MSAKRDKKAYKQLSRALEIIAKYRAYVPLESLRQIDDALAEWVGDYVWQDDPKIVRRIAPRVIRRLEDERYEEEQRQSELAEKTEAA